MQAACNCTKGMHPFDFDASSVAAQAHTSCNRRAGYYVRKTAPPLTPMLRLLDCGTGAATRGNPEHGPIVPAKHVGHGSVSRGRRRDGRYGQKWADSNGGSRRAEAAVKSSAGSRPLLEQQESPLPRCEDETPVPRMARARATAAPRTTRPVTLTPRQGRQHLWQAKRATLHLRHDDRVKKGVPRRSIFISFSSSPFSLLLQGPGKGILRKGSFSAKEAGSAPTTDQRFEGPRKCSTAASEHSGSMPTTGQRFEGWPLGRVRQPPQATRAPRQLLIRGSKAGPPKGSTAASEHAERGMTLGTSDTWPRLGLRSQGTLGHFRDQQERFCNGIPSEGGIEPSNPIKQDRVRQITCRYFWSAPLGH
jgi:hypothetical protein